MKKTDVIERLLNFNLSRQEAQLYICLWENGTLTGYEAGKLTGISRSNVYTSMNSLVEKGAAISSEGTTLLYQAVAPGEFLQNKMKELEADKKFIIDHLPVGGRTTEGYFTIQGSSRIHQKISHMIENCEMRLYFAAEKEIIERYQSLLKDVKERGLKVVLMTNGDFSFCCTKLYRDEPGIGQIRLITDSSYVLTGECTGKNTDTCLYSGQENLVTIMKDALRNKIKLIELEGTERMDNND